MKDLSTPFTTTINPNSHSYKPKLQTWPHPTTKLQSFTTYQITHLTINQLKNQHEKREHKTRETEHGWMEILFTWSPSESPRGLDPKRVGDSEAKRVIEEGFWEVGFDQIESI